MFGAFIVGRIGLVIKTDVKNEERCASAQKHLTKLD